MGEALLIIFLSPGERDLISFFPRSFAGEVMVRGNAFLSTPAAAKQYEHLP